RPLTQMELDTMRSGGGTHVKLIPGTFRPIINKDKDYMIDRATQKSGRTYRGVHGIAMQEAALEESMGAIQEPTKENLVSTDNAIIMARHRLRKAAHELKKGIEPPALDPECHRVRSASFVLPVGVPFDRAKNDAFRAKEGVAHTSI